MSFTTAQMIAAMNNPRYSREPAFRQWVEQQVAEGVSHGGTVVGNRRGLAMDPSVDFGKGGSNAGGISVKIGSDHRESGGVTRVSIDSEATYNGPLNSAHEIAQAISNPEYKLNPAYREQVAAALQQMTPTNNPKF